MICEENKCFETNTYLLNIESDMKVCFNGLSSGVFALKLIDYRSVAVYNYIYKTSAYKIKVESHSLCKSYGNSCWRGYCQKSAKHPIYKENNKNTTYGYGCDIISQYNGVCGWGYACVWYQWHVKLEGEQYNVYKLNYKSFEIDFELSTGDSSKKITISENKLNFHLDLDISEGLHFPLSIVSTLGSEKSFSNNIVEIGNEFLDADASELNLPQTNRIGDIQIDRRGKINLDRLSIVCNAHDEIVECAQNEPAINVLKKNRKSRKFKRNEKITDYVVKRKLSLPRSVSIMFSHINLRSPEVTKPVCKMAVSYSYGCKECNQNPRVIITSSSIKQEGMLYFKSNCSFNKQHLSCSYKPQTLELQTDEQYCYIYMEAINATIYVNIEYEFIGEVMMNPLIYDQAESFPSLISSVASNPNFIDGIFKSFVATSSIFIFITMLTRVLGKIAIFRLAANEARENN